MKGAVIVSKGLEETASLEIKELIGGTPLSKERVVIFDIKKLEDLCTLCYKTQSASRVLLLLDNFKSKDILEVIEEKINDLDIKKWNKGTFSVECERFGSHDFNSVDVERAVSDLIFSKTQQKVNLKNPDTTFFVFIYNDDCYLGVDLAGFDLSKREYRIFIHPTSLKGNLAYAMLREADYKKEDLIVDPFCSSGEIPIEAALFKTGRSPNYYRKDKFAFLKFINFDFSKSDKLIREGTDRTIFGYSSLLKYVKSSQKNAKIAGINKEINFSKIAVDWLDIKFKDTAVDKIVGLFPSYSVRRAQKDIDKTYAELFNRAAIILNSEGKICAALRNKIPEEVYKREGFCLVKEKEMFSGEQKYHIFIFEKQKP